VAHQRRGPRDRVRHEPLGDVGGGESAGSAWILRRFTRAPASTDRMGRPGAPPGSLASRARDPPAHGPTAPRTRSRRRPGYNGDWLPCSEQLLQSYGGERLPPRPSQREEHARRSSSGRVSTSRPPGGVGGSRRTTAARSSTSSRRPASTYRSGRLTVHPGARVRVSATGSIRAVDLRLPDRAQVPGQARLPDRREVIHKPDVTEGSGPAGSGSSTIPAESADELGAG